MKYFRGPFYFDTKRLRVLEDYTPLTEVTFTAGRGHTGKFKVVEVNRSLYVLVEPRLGAPIMKKDGQATIKDLEALLYMRKSRRKLKTADELAVLLLDRLVSAYEKSKGNIIMLNPLFRDLHPQEKSVLYQLMEELGLPICRDYPGRRSHGLKRIFVVKSWLEEWFTDDHRVFRPLTLAEALEKLAPVVACE